MNIVCPVMSETAYQAKTGECSQLLKYEDSKSRIECLILKANMGAVSLKRLSFFSHNRGDPFKMYFWYSWVR